MYIYRYGLCTFPGLTAVRRSVLCSAALWCSCCHGEAAEESACCCAGHTGLCIDAGSGPTVPRSGLTVPELLTIPAWSDPDFSRWKPSQYGLEQGTAVFLNF